MSRGPSLHQSMEYGGMHTIITLPALPSKLSSSFFYFFPPGAFKLTARNTVIGINKQRGLDLLWPDSSASKVKEKLGRRKKAIRTKKPSHEGKSYKHYNYWQGCCAGREVMARGTCQSECHQNNCPCRRPRICT